MPAAVRGTLAANDPRYRLSAGGEAMLARYRTRAPALTSYVEEQAHAANVQPKPQIEGRSAEVAKVVVAVETDPRRVRTGPRLAHSGVAPDSNRTPADKTLESARPPPVAESAAAAAAAGPSPWAAGPAEVLDKTALPSANLPRPEAAPPKDDRQKGTPLWLRLSAVATLLLLAFAVVRRFWVTPSGHEAGFGPVSSSIGVAPPLPDDPGPLMDDDDLTTPRKA